MKKPQDECHACFQKDEVARLTDENDRLKRKVKDLLGVIEGTKTNFEKMLIAYREI